MSRNENYRIFIRALTICQIAIKAMNNTVIKNPTKKDFGIIDRLSKHQQNNGIHKEYKNKFPNYVNELFKSFATNQVSIGFNFIEMKKYKGIERIFGVEGINGLMKFDYLSYTFTYCQYFTIVGGQSALNPLIITFTSQFADALFKILNNINNIKESKLETILYRACIKIDNGINKEKYEKKFSEIKWGLIFEERKTSYKQKNNDIFSMTLKKGHIGPIKLPNKQKIPSVSIDAEVDEEVVNEEVVNEESVEIMDNEDMDDVDDRDESAVASPTQLDFEHDLIIKTEMRMDQEDDDDDDDDDDVMFAYND